MNKLRFSVPEKKRIRVIVHTDCKNEADDQFALVHHLLTPKFDVCGIIAGHFAKDTMRYGQGGTRKASYDEIKLVMELEKSVPVAMGAAYAMEDEKTPIASQGADMIIKEALKDDDRPLFVVFQGAITDLACAYLQEPSIAKRMTAIWIGGGVWPVGGFEFNLWQDIHAANVVFSSDIPLWQVPMDVYKQMAVTLSELQVRCAPYGKIGKYLFEQMVDFNNALAEITHWPHGESWGLGDQATVTLLLEEQQRCNFAWKPAPGFSEEMYYIHGQNNRPIRVYHTLDSRMTMEDFYAKLQIFLPKGGRVMDKTTIEEKARLRRGDIITMIYRAGAGHIGGALSSIDILSTLFYGVMDKEDLFLLSKGHSVEGYWAILADLGYFPQKNLETFSSPGSPLIGHPNNKVPGVAMCTGALGHGLSIGVGHALAALRENSAKQTYVLMGDGEQAEGSIWEAAMAAEKYALENLTAIIDRNKLQISGTTEEVMPLEPFADKWRCFGWEVNEADGHDIKGLLDYFQRTKKANRPHVLIANTIKGKGLPAAEGKAQWHHHVPSLEQLQEGYKLLGLEGVDW